MELLLKLNNNNDIYYNANKYYSYPANFGVICGGRGIGKTTTFLIKAMENYIKREERFVYVRRYKTELKKFVSKNSLGAIVDGVRYVGDGAGGYIVKVDDEIIGYLLTLSVSITDKSTNFPNVSLLIYDEAILKRGQAHHYLNDEVMTFFDLVSTVFRTKDKYRVVILGNNLDLFNPYNEYFKVPRFDGIYFDKGRGLYIEYPKNSPKLIELEKKTPLYKLTKDTAYGDYHYDNKLLSTVEKVIIPKPPNLKVWARLRVNNYTLNMYLYYKKSEQHLFVELKNKIVDDNITYNIMANNEYNYYDIKLYKDKIGKFVNKTYYNGLVEYDNDKTGDVFVSTIQLL